MDTNSLICACGCGLSTSIANRTIGRLGWIKGQPMRYARGHSSRVRLYNGVGSIAEQAYSIARERSVPEPNTGCWLWTGGVKNDKRDREYAVASIAGRTHTLSRALLGLTDPAIKACHRCDTPLCVNRDHLFAGTAADNAHDRDRKGRCRAGIRQRNKTHCKHGHPFSPENTYVKHDGRRGCRACHRAAAAKAKARQTTADVLANAQIRTLSGSRAD